MKSILVFFCAMGFSMLAFSQNNDSTTIVKLLEKESATWRSGDSTAHADCWQLQPYSRVMIMAANGKAFAIPADKVVHSSSAQMGKGGTSKNTNYNMSIHGNTAIVTHNEASTSTDGTVSYTFEVRMLEKFNGQWKITGQIIQVL